MSAGEVSTVAAASLAHMPATLKQRRLVLAVGLVLLAVFATTAPLATAPLPQLPAFVPLIQAIIFVDDFITSILLFALYTIVPSSALLVLGSGYLFTALNVLVHTFAFPGAFAAGQLLGGLQSAPWLYTIWHVAQPAAIIAYAYLKDMPSTTRAAGDSPVSLAVVVVLGLVTLVITLTIGLEKNLPPLYLDPVHGGTFAWSYPLLASGTSLTVFALCLLWFRRKSLLDYWLLLVAWALLLEEVLFNFFSNSRYSVGFYTGRMLLLTTSIFVLALLLAETIFQSARLAHLSTILQRERTNKLMNLEAMAASISHELKQPLTAITMNGAAVLKLLQRTPPDVEEIRFAASDIIEEGHRSGQFLENIRVLFGRSKLKEEPVDLNEIVRRAMSAVRGELTRYKVVPHTALSLKVPNITGHQSQLEEVVINLCANAIEAMSDVPDGNRSLTIRTFDHNGKAAIVEVEDTGPGLDPNASGRVFDAFFSTKPGGMGLGLAISRMIVERHSGRLTLASAAPSGCIFRIELPSARIQLI